jgi:glycosyltransferase involved in cell wall biosynthesis
VDVTYPTDAGGPQPGEGATPGRRLRVAFLNWRDLSNPEGGGSERYVETVATALAARGHRVSIICAAHERAPAEEWRDGVRFVRRGGKLGVYPSALWLLVRRALGRLDVVVDVQNGVPFMSRLSLAAPVVVLVHHVHREQWPVVYGRFGSHLGWFVESRLAPMLYRGCPYVAVSDVTRTELADLGVRSADISVVHNGTAQPLGPVVERSPRPTVSVLGRLVPHKRVEHVLKSASALREQIPDLRVLVIGDGWWGNELRQLAELLGVQDLVEFTGFVTEARKHELLAQTWVLAAPSLKEGWGLSVMEAATHGVPTVAYRNAGGLSESIVSGRTGLLVEPDIAAFTAALRTLLQDDDERARLGRAARKRAVRFSWTAAAEAWETVLLRAADRERSLRVRDDSSPADAVTEGNVLSG